MKWKDGDAVTLHLDMPVRLTSAPSQVKANVGKRAVERGPLVYCAEAADNDFDIDNLQLSAQTLISLGSTSPCLGNLQTLHVETKNNEFILIPYYAWDNRIAGKMRVWFNYSN